MTVNGEMAFILRYFTEFGSFRGVKVVNKATTMDSLQLLSSSKSLQRDRTAPSV